MTGASLVLPVDRLAAGSAPAPVRPFRVALSVPPVLKPVKRTADTDYYEMTMRPARARIIPGTRTRIWGFEGRFPGPTIKAQSGRRVVVRHTNCLRVPTSTHLHGGKVPWKSDGHPSLAVAPGDAYDYVYPNHQSAATLWYHDHLCKTTSRNNYMGLSGLYVIQDEEEKDLNLPKGRFDVPLILQDRRFKANGSFRFRDAIDELPGNVYLVNGRPMPFMRVGTRKYRFRVLNGSHSRGYNLSLDNGAPLVQIGSDQGLLPAPYPAASIPLWPSERAEIVIDFSRYPVGTRIVLEDRSDPLDPSTARPVMQFRVTEEMSDDSSLQPVLRPIERLLPGPGVVHREFDLSKDFDNNRWVINGKAFNANRIDFKPRLGDTEIWTFINNSTMVHPMHVHLVRFQLLERRNLQLDAGEMGWKDTVRVDAASSVSVIMRFEGYTGRYMFHCHNLAHEDHSMMGQMQVVKGDGEQVSKESFEGGYAGSSKPAPVGYRCDFPNR